MREDGRSPNRNAPLAYLSEADFGLLRPHLSRTEFVRGHVLINPGDPVETVHFPERGVLSIIKMTRDGDAVEAATMGPESIDGVIDGLGTGVARHQITVHVEGDGYVIRLADFKRALNASTGIRDMVSRYLEALFFHSTQSSLCLAYHPAGARLARLLLTTSDQAGTHHLFLTHEFLATMIAVERSTLTTAAYTLQNAGLIRYRRGHIDILDRAGLEEVSCECYRHVRAMYRMAFPSLGPP